MSTEDKKVDINENEVETTDNATKAANNEKKERISAHKKAAGALGRLAKKAWKKGKKIAKDYAFEVEMASMVAGGLVGGATEANAQRLTRPTNTVEMSVDQIARINQQGGGSTEIFQEAARIQRSQTQGQYSQQGTRTRVVQQQAVDARRANLYRRIEARGEEVVNINGRDYVQRRNGVCVPLQIPHRNLMLEYSPEFSFGLNYDVAAAYLNPLDDTLPDQRGRAVWFTTENPLTGTLQVDTPLNVEVIMGGQGPYCISIEQRVNILKGFYGPMPGHGRVVRGRRYSKMDAALDGAHEFLGYVGEGVDLVSHGIAVAGKGKRALERAQRVLSEERPNGVYIPGGRGGHR